jgi:hypothetical protein
MPRACPDPCSPPPQRLHPRPATRSAQHAALPRRHVLARVPGTPHPNLKDEMRSPSPGPAACRSVEHHTTLPVSVPAAPARWTRRVQLVRGEGRDVSS